MSTSAQASSSAEVTSSHQVQVDKSSQPSHEKTSNDRVSKDENKLNEKPRSTQYHVSTTEPGAARGGGRQGGGRGGRRNRYHNDQPRHQSGDDKTDGRHGYQERQTRSQGRRNDRRKDPPPLSGVQPRVTKNIDKSVDTELAYDAPKAAANTTNEIISKQAKTVESRKSDSRGRPESGQQRSSRQYGRQQRRPRSPYRGTSKTVTENIDTSGKTDGSVTRKPDSEKALPEQSNVPKKQHPESKTVIKDYNYTKPKPEKLSSYRAKSRYKGQKSAPTVQSDQLAQQLTTGTYECMVCCECVRGRDQVWSCEGCFHVFHLKCIKKWASAPVLGTDEGSSIQYDLCFIYRISLIKGLYSHLIAAINRSSRV